MRAKECLHKLCGNKHRETKFVDIIVKLILWMYPHETMCNKRFGSNMKNVCY